MHMIILESAYKHGLDDADILQVLSEPKMVLEERETPQKLIFLGFDTKGRALEIITDTGDSGNVFVVHADKITKRFETLLSEVL
jgi:hypothetical protein